jgi:hypothetical protein
VAQDHRRSLVAQVLVAPAHDRDDGGIQAEALLGQLVLEALGLVLIAAAFEDPWVLAVIATGGFRGLAEGAVRCA